MSKFWPWCCGGGTTPPVTICSWCTPGTLPSAYELVIPEGLEWITEFQNCGNNFVAQKYEGTFVLSQSPTAICDYRLSLGPDCAVGLFCTMNCTLGNVAEYYILLQFSIEGIKLGWGLGIQGGYYTHTYLPDEPFPCNGPITLVIDPISAENCPVKGFPDELILEPYEP